jgi:hypothetical protein
LDVQYFLLMAGIDDHAALAVPACSSQPLQQIAVPSSGRARIESSACATVVAQV